MGIAVEIVQNTGHLCKYFLMRNYVHSIALGHRLKKHLKASATSQTSLAKELGVRPSQVSKVLAGKFKTAGGLVGKICTYAHINSQDFASTGSLDSIPNRASVALLDRLGGLSEGESRGLERVLAALVDCLIEQRSTTKAANGPGGSE